MRPLSEVFAVIITFFPDARFSLRLSQISKQVAGVIVVDNGTDDNLFRKAKSSIDSIKNAVLISNHHNYGIAAGLNIGIKRAISAGAKAVVTFDQDSTPDPHLVRHLLEAEQDYYDSAKLMVIGSNIRLRNHSSCIPNLDPVQSDWKETYEVVTSGSFFKTDIFHSIGFFNEKLFIDLVDREFCLRVRNGNFRIISAENAFLYHELGEMREHTFLNHKLHPTNHVPKRRYYQFRNSILLHKVHRKRDPNWCRNNNLILIKTLVLIILFENDKIKKLLSILKGVKHGISGRAGQNGEIAYTDAK
jgi:rhamnosyltransferase